MGSIREITTLNDGFGWNYSQECHCEDLDWCRLFEDSDKLKFQFIRPLGRDLVKNVPGSAGSAGSWTLGIGWLASQQLDGTLVHEHLTSLPFPLSQTGILTAGKEYKLTLELFDVTSGSLEGGGTTMTEDGVYTIYFTASGTDLDLTPTATFAGKVKNISCELVQDDFDIDVIDDTGATAASLSETNTDQNSIIDTDIPTIGLADGCYTIEIVNNGVWYVDDFKVQGTDWDFNNVDILNERLHFAVTGGGSGDAVREELVVQGQDYEVEYEITSITATADVTVSVGGTAGTTETTTGVKTETITAGSDGELKFDFNGAGIDAVNIEYVTLKRVNHTDIVSECIKVGDTQCTTLVKWSNDEDAFGYLYTDYENEMRLEVGFTQPSYETERDVRFGSGGLKVKSYSRYRKARTMAVSVAPEYIHDAIAEALEHDTFEVNDIEYMTEDEYVTSQGLESLIYNGEAQVEKADQPRQTNRNC